MSSQTPWLHYKLNCTAQTETKSQNYLCYKFSVLNLLYKISEVGLQERDKSEWVIREHSSPSVLLLSPICSSELISQQSFTSRGQPGVTGNIVILSISSLRSKIVYFYRMHFTVCGLLTMIGQNWVQAMCVVVPTCLNWYHKINVCISHYTFIINFSSHSRS